MGLRQKIMDSKIVRIAIPSMLFLYLLGAPLDRLYEIPIEIFNKISQNTCFEASRFTSSNKEPRIIAHNLDYNGDGIIDERREYTLYPNGDCIELPGDFPMPVEDYILRMPSEETD